MEQVRTLPFGVRSMVAPLRRVAVRVPTTEGDFAAAGWRRSPEPNRLRAQHEAFVDALTEHGCQVDVLPAEPGMVDACFAYDPVFVTARGAVVLPAAKPDRADEPAALARDLTALGVPVTGRLHDGAYADGGDLCWLDEHTLAAGRGYRTNGAALAQLRTLLGEEGVDLAAFDLPHDRGPAHVLHLMSVWSPVDHDVAVVFEPLAPVALLEALAERGIRRVAVDPEEYAALGSNVLATAPGWVVMFAGAPRTRAALEAAGVTVTVVEAAEIALGDGGPTCLTRPIWRE